MNDPMTYKKANSMQAMHAKNFLDSYLELVKWNLEGDTVIEIGCGVGNVTTEILMPMLPNNVKSILATDISKNMIEAASKQYQDPKLKFETLDIVGPIPESIGKFNHLFSFLCLHWIPDQERVMKNIYSLLKPGGDALFILACKCEQLYSTYKELSYDPRWEKYTTDVQNYISPFHYVRNPEEVMRNNLENAGFQVRNCTKEDQLYEFHDDEKLMLALKSYNPFIERMPNAIRDEYMEACLKSVKDKGTKRQSGKGIYFKYSALCVYAEKPLGF